MEKHSITQINTVSFTSDKFMFAFGTESGFYIYKHDVIARLNRRIGDNPFIVEVSEIEAVDIDEPEDFLIADSIYNHVVLKHATLN